MKRCLGVLAVLGLLSVLIGHSVSSASADSLSGSAALTTTFKVNVVFVGYQEQEIDLDRMKAVEPTVYSPLVRRPLLYDLNVPVGIQGDYEFRYAFAPETFNDAFFGHLASIGKTGALTEYQAKYNGQVHKSLTVGPQVLHIDAPSTELWLMSHARSDLKVDVTAYTVFFVNWHGREDFQFHVYTKTDSPDPDTGTNFGTLDSHAMIAWGGSHGRTWFFDLSAGPESRAAHWNVDDAHFGYRLPPVWEYGNLSGYRPFDDLSGDLALILRYVAVNQLFTAAPLFDPLASMPAPGRGKTVRIHMFEDDPASRGTQWIDGDYLKKTLKSIQPQYAWRFVLKDHNPLKGAPLDAFLIWAELKEADDCWNAYGSTFYELFCFFDTHRDRYLPPPSPLRNTNMGVFAFNTTPERLINWKNLAGYIEDDHGSGYPAYAFAFGTEDDRKEGHGFSSGVLHELGLYIGLPRLSEGYDSTSGTEFQGSDDTLFAQWGQENDSVMSSMRLSNSFGWFDRDNMNRFLAARALLRAGEIKAELERLSDAGRAKPGMEEADTLLTEARGAFREMEYPLAAQKAQDGLYRLVESARAVGGDVEIAPGALSSAGLRTAAGSGGAVERSQGMSGEVNAESEQESLSQKARLVLAVAPAGAGATEPSGVSKVPMGEPVSIMARAALGWRFVKWTTASEVVEIDNSKSARALALLHGDGKVVAHFEPGGTFNLSTSVYPEGAGTVTPSGTSEWNPGDVIEISAQEASSDFIFYKWECSEGCEILDAFKNRSAIRLAEGADLGSVTLTAHFLTLDSSASSAMFSASYAETVGKTRIVPVNRASVNLTMEKALAGVSIDKETSITALFNSGMAMTSHTVSDDPESVILPSKGAATFVDRGVNLDPTAETRMSWKDGSLSIGYNIKPEAEFNVVDLYSQVYKKGTGWISINASDTAQGGMPVIVAVEGNQWAMVCLSPGGMDFSGKGKSSYSRQIKDDLVSWSVKGSGSLHVYKWIAPQGATGERASGRAPAAVLAHRVGARRAVSVQTSAAADPGIVTNFNIAGLDPPRYTRAPFFFGGKVYSVSRHLGDEGAYINRGVLNSDGSYKHETSVFAPLGDSRYMFGRSKDWVTCVFKGQVFLFYTARSASHPSDGFGIYACSTSSPEIGWKNLGFVTYAGEQVYGIAHDNPNGIDGYVTPLKAVVFNGRLYLIFTAANGAFTFISSEDGKKWDWGGVINDAWSWNDKFNLRFNATVVMKNGIPTLCVVIMGTETYKDWCYFRFIDGNNNLVGGYHKYLDWVGGDRGVGVAAGSVKGSLQGPVVQVFGENSGWEALMWPPRRLALDVDSGNVQGWVDVPKSGLTSQLGPPDSVEVSMPVEGKPNDVRKYILFFNRTWSGDFAEYVDVVSYESDYYQAAARENSVNTADPKYADERAWWLVGVIDGVPPFTRNGATGTSSLSEVEYITEASQTEGADMKFSGEVYVETGFKAKVSDVGFQGGVSAKNIFSVASGYERKVKTKLSRTWQGTGSNADGKYGVLIHAKPTIVSRQYDWLSQDKTVKVGSYALVNINSVGLIPTDFELAAPPEGLLLRKPTSDLDYWKNERGDFPSVDVNVFNKYTGDPLVATDHLPSTIDKSKEVIKDKSITNKTTIEISGKVKAGLLLSGSASATAEFGSSTKEAYSEAISATLSKIPMSPSKASGNISQLIVDWAWYVPKEETLMKDLGDNIPEWVPTSARNQSRPPWYLTWKVLDVVKNP